MQFVHPSATVMSSNIMLQEFMDLMEEAGRTCWQSEEKRNIQAQKLMDDPAFGSDDPDVRAMEAIQEVNHKFLKHKIKIGHTSILEHSAFTVRIVTDRAMSHQLVRHRIGAFSQESQRFCDYMNGGHIVFIIPAGSGLEPGYYKWDNGIMTEMVNPDGSVVGYPIPYGEWPEKGMPRTWVATMQFCEKSYQELREAGEKPQDARSVLPNSAKTEVVATFNARMWRHVLNTRLHPSAQQPIRHVMGLILNAFMRSPIAPLFEDIADEYRHRL